MFYHAELSPAPRPDGIPTVKIGFGEPANNGQVVPAALAALEKLNLKGGRGILFHGAASLP